MKRTFVEFDPTYIDASIMHCPHTTHLHLLFSFLFYFYSSRIILTFDRCASIIRFVLNKEKEKKSLYSHMSSKDYLVYCYLFITLLIWKTNWIKRRTKWTQVLRAADVKIKTDNYISFQLTPTRKYKSKNGHKSMMR